MDAENSASRATGLVDSFGQTHFGACDLGDRRRVKRAVITADALMRHPEGTLPRKLIRKELMGFYDLANHPQVNHDNLLQVHRQHTQAAMRACPGTVLVIHDTTEADYSGLAIPDLGPIGNGGRRGLLLHNVLAVDYDRREVLGLVEQVVHRRRQAPRRESRETRRRHPQRESRLWICGVEAVGPPPAGATWVNLMDRGGDSFESLERQAQLSQFYVVRAKFDRRIEVQDTLDRWRRSKLYFQARKLPTLGHRKVNVSAQPGQPARQARVRVAAGAVRLVAPTQPCGEHSASPLEVWVVHVKEVDAPPGVEALEWFLLTNVPTTTRTRPGNAWTGTSAGRSSRSITRLRRPAAGWNFRSSPPARPWR